MTVVALNQISADEVLKIQREAMKEEMQDFIKNDPEARAMMIARVKEVISTLSNWDIEYHTAFKDVSAELLRTDDLKPLLQNVIKRVLTNDECKDYRIIESIGEYLAGKIKIEVKNDQ